MFIYFTISMKNSINGYYKKNEKDLLLTMSFAGEGEANEITFA